jgi:tetratricopeptide (TPR) repeat protein
MRNYSRGSCRLVVLAAILLALTLPLWPVEAAEDACKFSNKDIENKIAACAKIINSKRLHGSDLAHAYRIRGLAFWVLGDKVHATTDLNKWAKLDPDDAKQCLRYQGGSAELNILISNIGIQIDPDNAECYFNRSSGYASQGDFQRSLADAKKGLDLNWDSSVHSRLYTYYLGLGDWKGALAVADPKQAVWIKILMGDYEGALADNSAFLSRTDSRWDHLNRGIIFFAKGDLVDASAEFDRLAKSNSLDWSAALWSYIARARLGDNSTLPSLEAFEGKLSAADGSDLVLKLFLGRISHEQLDAEISSIDVSVRHPQDCYVLPHAGEWALLQKNYQLAKRYFEAIQNRCVAISAEYDAPAIPIARAELQRITTIEAETTRPQAEKETAAAVSGLTPSEVSPPKLLESSRRLALVIGNSNYASAGSLPNPRRDADAVAASLRSVGFQTVTVKDDMTRAQTIAALNGFSDQAANADWALVYFSGHGLELGGTNYVLPVDARLLADRDVQDEAVSLDRLLSATMRARKLHIVILDACRDNPFIPKMRQTAATRSVGRGLARVEPEGATLVVYAARDGQIAYDGDGQNSPFVTSLTKRLAEPNLEINKLFRLVHDDVLAATDRRQEPYVYGALPGEDFYFVQK